MTSFGEFFNYWASKLAPHPEGACHRKRIQLGSLISKEAGIMLLKLHGFQFPHLDSG